MMWRAMMWRAGDDVAPDFMDQMQEVAQLCRDILRRGETWACFDMALLPAIAGRYVDGHALARAISLMFAGQNVVVLGEQRDLLYHSLEVCFASVVCISRVFDIALTM